ncbi:MAG: 2-phosphosulfolactate phosphatase [Chloroflexi bacterium]|nr:2-phosphosulfolactate phosphatase [Chloroflexota bacterium]
MRIERYSLIEGARQARGLAVIIDVFRAFSVAAYAFKQGAREIVLVGEVAQAFALKERFPDALLVGEVGGQPIEGFDLGNSPTEVARHDLRRRRLIQRTSAGTQGVVAARSANQIVLGSLVCAEAIAVYARRLNPEVVSLVAMGYGAQRTAEEDEACAEILSARLRGEPVDAQALIEPLGNPQAVAQFQAERPGTPLDDIDYCLSLDRFSFVMPVAEEDGLLVARRVEVG